ncbi:MAG TPA: DUF3078 domain-containing protein [Luteibaculaceae bacterium]|nr:DUF3078 domain-containing protein [Luteibaculaceae bacterium]
MGKKKAALILALCLGSFICRSQTMDVVDTAAVKKWSFNGVGAFNFSQVALSNWNGGGQSAVSGTSLLNLNLNRVGKRTSFTNILNLAYGLQRLEGQNTRKTDDKIDFLSTYGVAAFNKWYYTSSINFRSQFAPGFNFPNDSVRISNWLAPGYLTGSIGLENKVSDQFTIFISPVTAKYTIVRDSALSAQGAFGVDPGRMLREEYGGSFRMNLTSKVMENVSFTTQLDLFSNYSENPQNVDVNWTTLVTFKVNKYINTSISTTLVYDDDVVIKQDKNNDGALEVNGPRTQFKEIFNFGLQYKF